MIAAIAAAALAAAGQQPARPPAAPTGQEAPDDRTWNRRASGAGDYQHRARGLRPRRGGPIHGAPIEPRESPLDLRNETAGHHIHYPHDRGVSRVAVRQTARAAGCARHHLDAEITGPALGVQGQLARAIEQLSAAYRSAVQHAAQFPDLVPARSYLAALLGVTELRRGELENCVGGHASASCIVPIAKAGLHHVPSGSQNATKYLTAYLGEHPDDLDMRWLLNVANMTLGTYPASRAASSTGSIRPCSRRPKIRVASSTSQRRRDSARAGLAGGVVIEDIDNDGLPRRRPLDRRLVRVASVLSSRARRHLSRSDRRRASLRSTRRPQPHCDRLQQRRPRRPVRDARRLGVSDAELAVAERRQRHFHRRHARERAVERSVPDALSRMGGLRQRRLRRRVRRPRGSAEQPLPQPGQRYVRGRRKGRGRDSRGLHQGRGLGRLRQRRLSGPVRVELRRRELPLPQRAERHLHRAREGARRREADHELHDLVLRLRQRRLARSVRHQLRAVGHRGRARSARRCRARPRR